jgi:outer membrane murein-binding lipoprotein Lpp
VAEAVAPAYEAEVAAAADEAGAEAPEAEVAPAVDEAQEAEEPEAEVAVAADKVEVESPKAAAAEAVAPEGQLVLDATVVNGTIVSGTSRHKADVDEQEAKRLELEIAVTALEQNIAELEEEIQLAKDQKAKKEARNRARAEMPEPPLERSELLRPHHGTDTDPLDSLESLREQMARAREEERLTTDENRLRELSRTISELQDWILRLEGPREQNPESRLVRESRES